MRVIKGFDSSEKNSCFDTFSFYLCSQIDFNILDNIYEQLEELQHPVDVFFECKNYFRAAEQNTQILINLLKATLDI